MSGKKCSNVSISRSRLDSLNARVQRSDDAARTARQAAEQERQNNRRLQQEFLDRQARAQAEHRRGLETLQTQMRSQEQRQMQRLDALQADFRTSMQTLAEDVDTRLREQSRQFRQAMQDHRQEVRAELDTMRLEIESDKERQKATAVAQLSDLETLIRLMRAQGQHAKYAPGQLETLSERLDLARTNIANGNYQAGLAAVQERYFEFQELQVMIAERHAEWQTRLAEAQRLMEENVGGIAAAEQATYSFGDTAQEIDAQVDFWSEGALSTHKAQLEAISAEMASTDDLGIDHLTSIGRRLDDLHAQRDRIVAAARESLIQSQLRQNIASSIVQSFEGTAWELDDSTYTGEDLRRGVHVKMRNNAGEEIIASVEPVFDEAGTYDSRVEINFFDRYNDENLRRERLKEMDQSMRLNGLNVEGFRCEDNSHGEQGNPQTRDFAKVRRGEAATTT